MAITLASLLPKVCPDEKVKFVALSVSEEPGDKLVIKMEKRFFNIPFGEVTLTVPPVGAPTWEL